MKFAKIVAIDNTGLIKEAQEQLHSLAEEVLLYNDFPTSNEEILKRIGNADCLLVSWNTLINREVIQSAPSLKYIGMCCSLYDEKSANVDILAARERGIEVLGVRDYGDEGVVEFIISELSRLLHGFGPHQWKEDALELTNQRLGIIGLGTLGTMLAKKAQSFGMEVFYYSRSRNASLEQEGITYLPLHDLLAQAEIISTHLPRNTQVLNQVAFDHLGKGKILVNTSLGPTFDLASFENWIGDEANYAIFDQVALGNHGDFFKQFKNVISTSKVSGWTAQAKARLSFKVLENMRGYLEKKEQ